MCTMLCLHKALLNALSLSLESQCPMPACQPLLFGSPQRVFNSDFCQHFKITRVHIEVWFSGFSKMSKAWHNRSSGFHGTHCLDGVMTASLDLPGSLHVTRPLHSLTILLGVTQVSVDTYHLPSSASLWTSPAQAL